MGGSRGFALHLFAPSGSLRLQAMLEDAEVVKLVHRVAVAIGSSDAYNKICRSANRQVWEDGWLWGPQE